jgi:beta-galactosidase
VILRARHAASGRERWSDATHTHAYRFHPIEGLRLSNEVVLRGRDMLDLPRIGIRLDLAAGYERLRYFGRGPWENYSDRSSSALLAVHETTVSDTYVPYVMPQEHGHRTDTRWLELSAGDDRPTLVIRGRPTVEFNASHFTAEDLYAAKHTIDLVPRPETILYLDAAHRGLGTASCGPDTLERYRLLARRYAWEMDVAVQ